jgi:hypothetical protein
MGFLQTPLAMVAPLTCPKCGAPLSSYIVKGPCPGCRREIEAHAYPALLSPPKIGNLPERIDDEQDVATCFHHPDKKAVAVCDHSGIFLCGLCDIPMGGKHFSPQALAQLKAKGQLPQLVQSRTRWDSICMSLAILGFVPPVLPYFFWITAPATIYLVIRHWNSPPSMVNPPRWRLRFIFALIFATLQLTIILIVLWVIFDRILNGPGPSAQE